MDRATNITYRTANGNITRSFDYEFDALGMITNKVVSNKSRTLKSSNYEYDSINRLISENSFNPQSVSSEKSVDYKYDLAGNRTSVVDNGVTNQYMLGVGNRLENSSKIVSQFWCF